MLTSCGLSVATQASGRRSRRFKILSSRPLHKKFRWHWTFLKSRYDAAQLRASRGELLAEPSESVVRE